MAGETQRGKAQRMFLRLTGVMVWLTVGMVGLPVEAAIIGRQRRIGSAEMAVTLRRLRAEQAPQR